MAIYRAIQMSFWTDSKVVDNFTPEDKYFYLYLMTNPHTNLAGCYEVSLKQVSDETGYAKETVEKLIERMEVIHNVIRYSQKTKEILILNWSKYNWTKSADFQKPLLKEIDAVKDVDFKAFLDETLDGLGTVLGRSRDGVGTTVTVTVHEDSNNFVNDTREIIDYLNNKINTNYRYSTKSTKVHVHARLKEGYTVDDFKKVIDNKCSEWAGTDMEKYLRPETLFGTKFEGYLNQRSSATNRKVRLEDL